MPIFVVFHLSLHCLLRKVKVYMHQNQEAVGLRYYFTTIYSLWNPAKVSQNIYSDGLVLQIQNNCQFCEQALKL